MGKERGKHGRTYNQLTLLEREARPLPNLKKVNVLVRRPRLGRPQVPLPPDRIDHIAARTTVRCTDRSQIHWKTQTNVPKEEEAPPEKPSTRINKPYEITNY